MLCVFLQQALPEFYLLLALIQFCPLLSIIDVWKFIHYLQRVYLLHLFRAFHSELWWLDKNRHFYLIFLPHLSYLRENKNDDDYFDILLTVHFSVFISVINQLDVQNFCFTISLFHACMCLEHHVLIIRRSKLYYTASGIIIPTVVMIPEAV